MHRTQTLIIYMILVVLTVGCTHVEKQRETQTVDSLFSDEDMMRLLDNEPRQALLVIDSAEEVGSISHFDAELLRAKVKIYDESSRNEARIILERLLRQDNLSLDQQSEVLGQFVYMSRLYQDNESMLKYGAQYIEVCRQLGEETNALVAQSDLGEALTHLGRTDEGLAKIDDAIAQLDRVRRFSQMDACIRIMKIKINTLSGLGREEEIIPVGEHILEKLQDYAEHPADYADESPILFTDEERPRYIDFYSGQAYAFIAYAYACDDKEGKTRDKKAARQWLDRFNSTQYSHTFNGRKLIASTWFLLGEYDKMHSFYNEFQSQLGDDTLHDGYGIVLHNRAEAYAMQGHLTQSIDYWRRYSNLKDYLNDSERNATAQEYAARFHEQELQLILEKEQASKKRISTIALLLGVMMLTVVVFIILLLHQLRSIRKKNAVLSKEITDRIEYEEKYHSMVEKLTVEKLISSGDDLSADNLISVSSKLEEFSDKELFEFICHVILKENLHLNPLFERQHLIDRFHLTKERIGAAFSKGSRYPSLAAFINELRLIHAAKLLVEQPDMSIADITTASGFTSGSVFSRNFKQRYALTPSQFREEKNTASDA